MIVTFDSDDRFWNQFEYDTHEPLRYMIVAVSGSLVAECAFFLGVPSVQSYETSLVTAFPLIFWVLFYGVLVTSLCIIVLAFLTDTVYWRHGTALLLSNYLIFFFLPKARGYKFYHRGRADILHHLGQTKAIVETGSLHGNFYPGSHVLMAELRMSGIPLDTVPYLTAFLFTTLFIVSSGLLVNTLWQRRKGTAIGIAVATPLVFTDFHLTNHPAVLSFMILPLVLLLLERYRRSNANLYLVLFLILGFFVMFTHPMTTIFMSIMIAVTAVYSKVHSRFVQRQIPTLNPRIGLVFPVFLFGWLANTRRMRRAVQDIVTVTEEPPPAGTVSQKTTEISFSVSELALKFLTLYGTLAIYFTLAGAFSLLVLVAFKRRTVNYGLGSAVVQFGVGGAIFMTLVTSNIIVDSIMRVSRYAFLFAILIISLITLKRLSEQRILIPVVVVMAVLGAGVIGADAAYEPNHHMTYTEYDGTEFILNHNGGETVFSADTAHKMEKFVLGRADPSIFPPHLAREYPVPPGLGYGEAGSTAAEIYGDGFLVTKDYDREQHTAEYFTPEQQEFLKLYDEGDMETLHADRTANKVYSNGGFEGWEIRSAA